MKIQAKLYRYYQKRGLGVLASCVLISVGFNTVTFAESASPKDHSKPASVKTSRANLNAGSQDTEKQDKNNVFVVSDSEVQTFNNISDVIEENKVLKEQRQVLLDHSRLLRDKYKKLYEYCSKTPESCPNNIENGVVSITHSSDQVKKLETKISDLEQEKRILEASISKAKDDIKAKDEEVASIKKETLNHSASKDDLLMKSTDQVKEREKIISERDAELAKKNEEVAKLQVDIEQKTKGEKACLDQIETSSSVLMRIPELEGEIVSLRNQLLIKKTTAELLGVKVGNASNVKVDSGTSPKINNRTKFAPPIKEENINQDINLAADVAVVEVVGDKVSLRVGPGTNNSSLMDVQKGARLTVEAREGEWLRVNAPTGGRAYINSNYVRTFDKNGVMLSEAKMTEPVNQSTNELSMKIDTPEPVKPPIPRKAAKKVSKMNSDKDVEPFGEQIGKESDESVAMEKLLKAMSQPEKKSP